MKKESFDRSRDSTLWCQPEWKRRYCNLIVIGVAFSLSYLPLHAQLRGTHLLGDMGLQSGSQASPSFSPALTVYDYHTSKFISPNGDKVNANEINSFLLGLSGILVTNAKIFGANYGASILIAFASSKIEGDLVTNKTSLGFTDLYLQPIQLGWQRKQADFLFGYALYLPTGKYESGASDNSGLGFLTNEISAGATVYFDDKKEWNFSTLLSYALNSPKKNTGINSITVGDLLSIEGGMGKTWYRHVQGSSLPMTISVGLVYYMQFKITEDKMAIPSIGNTVFDLANKDHVFALGAEGNIFIPRVKSSIDLRWLGELGARNRTEGNTFFIRIAPYIKFFEPKKTRVHGAQ